MTEEPAQPRRRTPRTSPSTPAPEPDVPDDQNADEQPAPAAVGAVTTTTVPTVQKVGEWHLVTHGTWQISVAPDGLLMLPRHLHPREWDDFVAAAEIARQVGSDVVAANTRKAKSPNRRAAVARRGAIVTEGTPPAGTTRMTVSQQQAAATIGRPRRGQRPANPMTAGKAIGG